jgi:hypothetical protein
MPVRIKLKNSVIKDKAPLPADLEIGELGVNAHQDSPALYLKDNAGAIRKIAAAPDATTSVKGVVQLADAAAITAGTAGRVVDAAMLQAHRRLVLGWACGDEKTPMKVQTAVVTDYLPVAMTLKAIKINVVTAPTGAAIVLDVKINGVSIAKPQIVSRFSNGVVSYRPNSLVSITTDSLMTVDVTQVGATVAGVGLKMYLIGTEA